jgi:sugar/nucleoside kinase (ribokinase family)
LYFMQSDEEVTVSAPTVLPIDTTGSGDVFGSVFLLVFLLTRSYAQALTLAVRWASWNTELRSIYQLIDSDLPDQLLEQGLIIS